MRVSEKDIIHFHKFISKFNLSSREISDILRYFKRMAEKTGIPIQAWPLPDRFEVIQHLVEMSYDEENDEMISYRQDEQLFDYINNLQNLNELGKQEIDYITRYRKSKAQLIQNFEWYNRMSVGETHNIDNFHIVYKGFEETNDDNKYIYVIGYKCIPFIVHEFSSKHMNIPQDTNLLSYLYYGSLDNINILNNDIKHSFKQFINNYILINKESYTNFSSWLKNEGIKMNFYT